MGNKYDKECKGGEDCYEDQHLCKVAKRGEPDLIREIIRDARFFCRKCGRSAHNADNLCKPLEL